MESRSEGGTTVSLTRRWWHALAPWGLFVTLSLVATHPLASVSTTHIPQGSASAATVPLLNLWAIWWNVDSLERGYHGYWDAPIYYPVQGMFTATEPQTVVGWLAWPLWKVLPTAAAVYNTLLLLFLTLNGWCGYRLLRLLKLSWPAALGGGAMLTLAPIVHWQLGVFQLVSLWGVLWTLGALVRFQRKPGPLSAMLVGIAFATTYSLCCYFGLLLSMVLLASCVFLLGRRLTRPNVWCWGAVSLVTVGVLLAPIVSAQLEFSRQHPFRYPDQWFWDLSAAPSDYLRTPSPQLVSSPSLGRHAESASQGSGAAAAERFTWPLSPGTLKYCLAIAGFGAGLWSRRRRRVSLFLAAIVMVAMLLSFGPRLSWGDLSLHRWLAEYYPGFERVRSTYRFAFFVQLGVILLAGIGLHAVHLACRRWQLPRRWPGVTTVAVLALGLLLAFEAPPSRPRMLELPATGAADDWIAWLRREPTERIRLAFLPLPASSDVNEMQRTAEWMFFQTYHQRPMLNGYSIFVPAPYRLLRDKLEAFPSQDGVDALRTHGITHVVFDQRAGDAVDDARLGALGMKRVVEDRQAMFEIWQLANAD